MHNPHARDRSGFTDIPPHLGKKPIRDAKREDYRCHAQNVIRRHVVEVENNDFSGDSH